MTRNNQDQSKESCSTPTISIDENITNLPDLSDLQEEEKRHILKVLLRDEHLRNEHLSRFTNLRKEVTDLEQHSQTTSTSVCARCQTPFGYIFNTGDACPKCGAKVCKQCRLMYNGNDSGWLCQLCCKQMQLMSYSGEWIYSIRSNLRKDSKTPSEIDMRQELSPTSVSTQHLNVIQSSSDSEPEEPTSTSNKNIKTIIHKPKPSQVKPKIVTPNDKMNKLIVQNEMDEKKLKSVREFLDKRPLQTGFTLSFPKKTRQFGSVTNTINSSLDDTDSVFNRSVNQLNSSKSINNKETLKARQSINSNQNEIDCASVTSSEWEFKDENKLKTDQLTVQKQKPPRQSSLRDSRQSLSSTKKDTSSHRHISGSMQSLRHAFHRVHHPKRTSSRITLNSENKNNLELTNDENTKSLQDTSSITMTEFYHREQQPTKLIEDLPLLPDSEMPSFYPSTRHRSFITKHFADRDDENDPNSIYKEQIIVQVFQHWKIKTLEHQHGINNSARITTPHHFTQALSNTTPLKETSNIQAISDEISANNHNNDISNINESEKPITTLKKRTTPLPASYAQRKANLKSCMSAPTDISNPNLLTPYAKSKPETTVTTGIKKSNKPSPIFIAPKKTQPSLPARLYSPSPFDESTQNKRKNFFEKPYINGDEQNSMPIPSTWAPAPSTTLIRFHSQSSNTSIDDDVSSSDESDHESLLIRNKNDFKKIAKKNNIIYSPPIHSNLNIPTAVFITDPTGHTRAFDLNNDSTENMINIERIIENDYVPINNTFDYPSSPIAVISPSTSSIILDKHALHSIGEEEEESVEKNNNDGIILSKELNRIEAFTRSRQIDSNAQEKDTNHENNKLPLERRWSDGAVSDNEEQAQSPLVKTTSTMSVAKQPITPPVKLSKTKLLLMKLHLAPSPNKDDDSNTSSSTATNQPAPRKRTVRRSSDKKHSHANLETSQLSANDAKDSSDMRDRSASNASSPESTKESHSRQSFLSSSDRLKGKDSDINHANKRESIRDGKSVGDSDDDIDSTFETAKSGSTKRSNSRKDLRGSLSNLSRTLSKTSIHYDLDVSGTIELKLTYNKASGSLDILINKCKNLAASQKNGTSNPYCQLYLLPNISKAGKRTTSLKKATTEPLFDQTIRYYVSEEEFDSRTISISVWSQASMKRDEFLGEIQIPLANCTLDKMEEYTLLPKIQENNVPLDFELAENSAKISFELSFMPHPQKEGVGTIQVNSVHATGIYYGKHNVEAICKGLLMPDKIKRKLTVTRKGPSPKWDSPLRWENISLSDLPNQSIEISIWCQERFKKLMIAYIRLNLSREHRDAKSCKWLDATDEEKSAWKSFIANPKTIHKIQLPWRPAATERK